MCYTPHPMATSANTANAIRQVVRLRQAEASVDPSIRSEIEVAREFLEDLVGPSVKQADAARLLGISQPALGRWIDRGEVASVLTPGGHREVPLSELVELVDEVERAREEGHVRALSHVIKERRRRAKEAVDLNRL